MRLCVALVCLTSLVPLVPGAKILALLTLTTHSHHIWNRELTRALASRGHDVTVLSPDVDGPRDNLTYLHLEGCYDFIRSHMGYEELPDETIIDKLRVLARWATVLCDYQLKTDGARRILAYPDGKIFDLIITEAVFNECWWPIISKFGNPTLAAVSPSGLPPRVNLMSDTPKNPAYVPDSLLPLPDHVGWWQRLQSLVADVTARWFWNIEYMPHMKSIAEEHLPGPVVPLDRYERNISLVLSNTVHGYDPPRPLPPNVIPVGGLHLRPAAPLPQKLQEFLDNADKGAIFFSLGSNLRSDMLSPVVIRDFLDVFAELPQRVLWKYESDDLQPRPDNLLLGKWLPQRDILGHKNIKLFITHNGLMSSQESLYFGVPTVGIPFFMDQDRNKQRAIKLGTGVGLSHKNLNKQTIMTAIKQVLTNVSYAENARRMSAVFRDQIDHPLDRAVYWVEYMLRHNGAPHLKSAGVDMPLYQYLLLDVIAVLLVALVLAVLVLRAVVLYMWRQLSLLRPTVKKNKTQ